MENVPAVVEQDGLTVQALYDEAYLTLRIHKEGYRFGEETLYVPLDVTPPVRQQDGGGTGQKARL